MLDSTGSFDSERAIVVAPLHWEVEFIHGNPETEGFLQGDDWQLDVPSLLDTDRFNFLRERMPWAAEMFQDSTTEALGRLERLGANAAVLTDAGKALWNIGNFEYASDLFNRALAADSSYVPARLALARLMLRWKDYRGAYTVAREYIEHPVLGASATIIASDAAFRQGRQAESLNLLQAGAVRWSNNPFIRLDIGIVLVSMGQTRAAAGQFRSALQIEPNLGDAYNGLGLCYIQEGLLKKAAREFRLGMAVGGVSAKAVHNLGRLYQEMNQHREAIRLLSEHIDNYAEDSLAIFMLANSHFWVRAYSEAAKLYLKLLETFEFEDRDRGSIGEVSHDALLNNLGVSYMRLGRWSESLSKLSAGLQVANQWRETILGNLFSIHLLDRDYSQAQSILSQLSHDYGSSPKTLLLFAVYDYNRGNYDSAVRRLNRLVEERFTDPSVYTLLGILKGEWLMDLRGALATVRQGLRYHPQDEVLINGLAYYLIQSGDLESAQEVMARENWPQNFPPALATKGLFHFISGDFHAGTTLYNDAQRVATQFDVEVIETKKRLEMARFYLRRNEYIRAKRELRRAVRIDSIEPLYRLQARRLLDELEAMSP